MLKTGIVGCGLQAATIAGYLGIYGDNYQVDAVMDINHDFARARIKEKNVRLAPDCRFYDNLDDFIAKENNLDGVIIGTFCGSHTETACKLARLNVPLYIEKPVSINLEQASLLYSTFKNSSVPLQVSLPLRLCPLTMEAKALIDSGAIGTVEQIVGYEDAGGGVYFSTWFRDYEKTGGMFMQKAVHDIDYMLFLAGSRPKEVCAMKGLRVFGGDKPYTLSCDQCNEQEACPESPYNQFHECGNADSVADALKYRYGKRMCRFSKGIKIEDITECIVELESGAQLSHTQNFFVSNQACRRGARLYGYRGTLEMNFGPKKGAIKVMSHRRNKTQEIEVDLSPLSHCGGDKELVCDFLKTMKTGERGRTDLITGDGIFSTLCCLCARESADRRQFIKIAL